MTQDKKKITRCVIYTRKSHEEGLEQEFNSLDAQREAGMAYIASQQHEGWELIERQYDDGGVSGGTLKRPALDRLMGDIEHGGIDLIIVYKVDRLTRSLSDFAKLVDHFDEHGVSFVSVTQQFNTANSMGRLTLNVLLSFAQYEREITGERIRDKIAASKKKGMWMGGVPPLGYRIKDRSLEPIEHEAELVQRIFSDYLNKPSLVNISHQLNEEGYRTKEWISQSNNQRGGNRFTPKYLYRLLTNPVVIGKIKHKKEVYDGEHPAIISETLFFNVNQIVNTQAERVVQRWTTPFLLKGKLRHYQGYAMSPSTRQKAKKNRKTPTRYYVSQKAIKEGYARCELKCINADHIENIVMAAICAELGNKPAESLFEDLDKDERQHELRAIIKQATLAPDCLKLELKKSNLDDLKMMLTNRPRNEQDPERERGSPPELLFTPERHENDSTLMLEFDIQIKKLDGRRFLLDSTGQDLYRTSMSPNPSIVEAIGRSYVWRKMLESGDYANIKALTDYLGFEKEFVRKQLTLTTLSPDIQHKALTGLLPLACGVKQLIEASQYLSWDQQRQYLRV